MFGNPKRETCSARSFRAPPYLYSAALLLFMRRTTIPNSSFLIPHSRKAFIHNQWTEPPKGLTLNLITLILFHVKHDALPFNNNNHIFKGENDHGKRNA